MANAEGKAWTAEGAHAGAGETMDATIDVTMDATADATADATRDATAGGALAEAAAQPDRAEPSDAIDPVIEALLGQLWEAANESSGKIWSLAKLSKRSQIPQSALRRYLTSLTEAGLVTVTLDEAGLGSSTLTEFGRSVCSDLFGTAGPARPGG
jgi:hypothetical protein